MPQKRRKPVVPIAFQTHLFQIVSKDFGNIADVLNEYRTTNGFALWKGIR